MPVGAGGEALGRIEAALAAEDPALVESFHRWGPSHENPGPGNGHDHGHDHDGGSVVGRRTGLTLLLGLVAIGVGPSGVLALLLLGGTLLACVVTIRWMERGPAAAG
jgi:hypothetical protein